MSLFERLNKVKSRPAEPTARPRSTRLASLPGGRETSSRFGQFVLLEDSCAETFPFPQDCLKSIENNLRLIRGIGPCLEEKLRGQGLTRICDLIEHPRWGNYARFVHNLILERHVPELRSLGARDWELLSYFTPEDLVFLDIETTGLWASQPLFLIGLLYYRDDQIIIKQYFARHYSEEKAVLAAANELLQQFKVVVSYNGKRFDVPYITGRSVEHRLFFSYPHHQVDMLYHARRRFKGKLPDCRLITLEEQLLNFEREDDIPGFLIPETYHRFVQRQDVNLVQPIIDHNRLDLLAMARMFNIVDHSRPEY
jgi:uncharacterized protein YprB with RNaseH-like and TPR domain